MTEYVFGVDIGGTTVKMGLFTSEGELMEKWEIPTRTQNGGELIFTDVADSIIAKMQENKISIAAGLSLVAAKKAIVEADCDSFMFYKGEDDGIQGGFDRDGGNFTLLEKPGLGLDIDL